jgi:membrane associated rhomboid family serine protease
MIPLRSSERIYSPTPVVAVIIGINVLIFLYQFSLSPSALNEFVMDWGIVPSQLNLASLFTSMFLHGGWSHLLGNMLFLWVFGRNLEDLIGSERFAGFYVISGVAAGIVHVIANSYSRVPTIGASGAIAAVMGAYLIKFPRSYVDTLVWFIFITRIKVPAPYFLIYWFAIQFFNGLTSLSDVDYTSGGTAWFAHIGGFLVGLGMIKLFQEKRPKQLNWFDQD